MSTITRKIEIKLCTEGLPEEEKQSQRNLLWFINDNLYKAANEISSKLYLNEQVSNLVQLKHPEYLNLLKEIKREKKKMKPDQSLIDGLEDQLHVMQQEIGLQGAAICQYAEEMDGRTLGYRIATGSQPDIFGQILTCLNSNAFKTFQEDRFDVSRGLRSIRNYKKGMPIPFQFNKSINIVIDDEENYFLKWFSGIKFNLYFGKDRSNNRIIVERAISKDPVENAGYKLCDSSIQYSKANKKWFLLLVVKIPAEIHHLCKDVVVGVDLGINVPAYVATNCTEDREAIGSRKHFLETRLAFQKRYKNLQRLKNTAGGRGRAKKLEPLERVKEAERNWVHTQNHLFSHKIVDFAIRMKAATINMEDLSGYGKDREGNAKEENQFFLRNWSYYELQSMIEYKAKKAGIAVVKISPSYTSQTCSWCGEKGLREGTSFTCTNPNCMQYGKTDIHADYNAARNIAKVKK